MTEAADDLPVRRLRVWRLREVTMGQTRHIWTDYLPAGEAVLLVGKPGLGKSTLVTDAAAKLTTGQLDGDCKGEPRHDQRGLRIHPQGPDSLRPEGMPTTCICSMWSTETPTTAAH